LGISLPLIYREHLLGVGYGAGTTLPDLPSFDEWFDSWVEAALLDVREVRRRSPLRRLVNRLFKGPFGDS
jgi:hypothetical protein